MARSDDNDQGFAVPEADRVDQAQPADPRLEDEPPWPTNPAEEASEADRLDQAQSVPGDPDEEYTREAP